MTGPAQELCRAAAALAEMRRRLDAAERGARSPVAIVGMGCRFPGGIDGPEALWQALAAGRDLVGEVPRERWDAAAWYDPDPERPGTAATRWGAYLDGVDRFDAAFFGISPREAASLDPQQRLVLEVAWEALEDAGLAADRLAGSRTAVYVAINGDDYGRLATVDPAAIDAYSVSGGVASVAAGRVSYFLDLAGASVAVDTACSSSLVALHMAVQALRHGECDLAIVAGVYASFSPHLSVALTKARLLAADGRCKAFDARADGFVQGEGCAALVLAPLAAAGERGLRVQAVVRGSAVNQDGRSGGLTAPSAKAQEAVLRAALADAGVAAASVGYLEAHGTGTALGDPLEARALDAVFGPGRGRPLVVGSVKTNLGHTGPLAGLAGVMKTVLALGHRAVPPHLHFTALSPHIELAELALDVPTTLRPWPAEGPADATDDGAPRRAGVSSFGLSGTNAHVVLEEAPSSGEPAAETSTEAPRDETPRPELLVLSAATGTALRAAASRLRASRTLRAAPFADVAFTAAVGRAALPHRLAAVAADGAEAAAALDAFLAGDAGALAVGEAAERPPRIAFVVAGQGTQRPGMGRELMAEPAFRDTVTRLDAVWRELPEAAGEPSLADLLADPDVDLAPTARAQPALYAFAVALAAQWRAWGVAPAAVFGHSAGEVAAAAVAGVLSAEDGLRLAAARGRLMQTMPAGAMASFAAPRDEVAAALAAAGLADDLHVAAENGPASTVVAGRAEAVAAALAKLEIPGRRLAGDRAFHSPDVEAIAGELVAVAATLEHRAPRLPLVVGEDGRRVERLDAEHWRRQARRPVLFAAAVAALAEEGCDVFLELGADGVLGGLGRACRPEATWVPSQQRDAPGRRALLAALGALWTLGAAADREAWWRGRAARRVTLPTYPWERRRHWLASVPVAALRPAGGRPLLGRRVPSPLATRQYAGAVLDLAADPWLADHRVHGRVVVAGAVHLAALLAAARDVAGDGEGAIGLEGVSFDRPLELRPEDAAEVQVVVEEDGRAAVWSRPAGDDSAVWARHADARRVGEVEAAFRRPSGAGDVGPRVPGADAPGYTLSPLRGEDRGDAGVAPTASVGQPRRSGEAGGRSLRDAPTATGVGATPASPASPADAEAAGGEATDGERSTTAEWAAALAELGVEVGPAFRGVEALTRGTDAAEARVRATVTGGDYEVHPTLLDACLQAAGGLLVGAERTRTWLPVGIERLVLRRRPPAALEVTARRRAEAGDAVADVVVADLVARDAAGDVVLEVTGFRVRPASATALARALGNASGSEAPPPALVFDWVPAPLARGAAAAGDCWIIGGAAARELAARLPGDCHVVASPAELPAVGVERVVVATALDAAGDDPATSERLLVTVEALVRAVGDRTPRLLLLTRGAVREVTAPAAAALWGLGPVLAAERPELRSRVVDLDDLDMGGDLDAAAAAVAAELAAPDGGEDDGEDRVAWRRGERLAPRLVPLAAPAGPPVTARIAVRDTTLVTGGLGALGLAAARWAVERGGRHLVLVGRRPPSQEAEAAIAALRERGATVVVHAADVADPDAVAGLRSVLAELPPLRGVVHAAGLVAEGLLGHQDAEGLAAALRPKAAGALHLDRLVAGRDLDFFVLCSSLAAFVGAPAQAGYAAGNAVLDAVAAHRRARGLPALSVGWGRFRGGVAAVDGPQARRLDGLGLAALDPDAGLAALDALLSSPTAHAVVAAVDWPRFLAWYPSGPPPLFAGLGATAAAVADPARSAAALAATVRQAVDAGPGADGSVADVRDYVRAATREVLALPADAAVADARPLTALGLDSLLAVELRNRVNRDLGLALPLAPFLQGSTAAELADRVAAALAERRRGAPAESEWEVLSL